MIYSGGFVIAEGKDSPIIRSSSYKGAYEFFFQNNASVDNHGALMELKEELLQKENTDFVVESWLTPGPEKEVDRQSCLTKSSDALRHLIDNCFENVLLREPTNGELSAVQKFKDEFERKFNLLSYYSFNFQFWFKTFEWLKQPNSPISTGTKIPFKIVYKNMTVRAQWNANIEREQFKIDVWDEYPEWLGEPPGNYNYIRAFASESTSKHRLMKFKNYQKDREFVIEGSPRDGPYVDCHDVKTLNALTVTECKGQIRARVLTEDDQWSD